MKNLIAAAMVLTSIGAFGQDAEVIFVKGIDSIEVGGLYTLTAVDRDLVAFEEIIDEAVRVLAANGIEFKDQLGSDSSIRFKNPEKTGEVHYKIVREEYVQVSWVISTDNGIGVLAFLELFNTGFKFSVEARYL